MSFSFCPEVLTRALSVERSVSPSTFDEDFSSSGITIGTLFGINYGEESLRARSQLRDTDRHYPIIFKSPESRAKSEIPRLMEHRKISDDYNDMRWNITGSYGCPKINWRLGRSYNFTVMKDGKAGAPRREYMSKVKSTRGIY